MKAPVAICRGCGFVTVRPRWDQLAYKEINALWYPTKFADEPPTDQDEHKKFDKWDTMWDRIGHYYSEPQRLLDVGAGQGWAIEFLLKRFPTLEAVAIEQWKPSQDYIQNTLGARVLDLDIGDDWPDGDQVSYDLVILRHTLEHIWDPLRVLKQIAVRLRDTGYAYIVVPNALRIKPGQPVRTDAFRPVHLHNFNEFTFQRLAGRAGLAPVEMDATGGEIWAMFKRGEPVTDPTIGHNSYPEQRAHILQRLAQTKYHDRRRIVRYTLAKFAPRWVPRPLKRVVHRVI